MLEPAGHFLFRWRNILFPVVLSLLLVLAPPRAFGDLRWDLVAIAGVAVVVAGQTMRVIVIGLDYIKRGGRGGRIAADRLVTGGVYAHTRNPMYLGNLLVVWGTLALVGRPVTLVVGGVLFTLAYSAIVAGEESFLLRRFGDSYREYCATAPRWAIRLEGLVRTIGRYRFDWPGVIVKEHGTIFSTAALITVIVAWKSSAAGTIDQTWPWLAAAGMLEVLLYAVARYLKKGRGMVARGASLVPGSIEAIRGRIDAIDASMLRLLNERAAEVASIFALKRGAGIDRVDPDRMEAVLVRLERINRGPLSGAEVRRIYGEILRYFSYRFDPLRTSAPAQNEVDDGALAIEAAELHAARLSLRGTLAQGPTT